MRVLHVNKYLYRRGGAEAYMLDLAALQTRAGHEVAFWGMEHPENAVGEHAPHLAPFVELAPTPTGVAPLASAAARMLWSPAAARGIARSLDAFRPDVVHLHNIYHQLSPSILRPVQRRGVPMVMTLHDYKMACPSYQFLDHGQVCESCLGRRFHHAVIRRCKDDSLPASALLSVESTLHHRLGAYEPVGAFICPSRFAVRKMEQARLDPDRIVWLRHFVDLTDRPAKDVPGGPLLYAGRLSHEKAVDIAIRAVGRSGPEVRLEVAGEGPERTALEGLADDVAPGRVTFHGRLDRPTLERLMVRCSALVMPSRWHEDAPMIVLEAYGAGLPVIGTTLGGVPELIDDGVDGWLPPPNDVDAVAAAMSEAMADPAETARKGLRGRDKVKAHWSTQAHLDGLDRAYAQAADWAVARGRCTRPFASDLSRPSPRLGRATDGSAAVTTDRRPGSPARRSRA